MPYDEDEARRAARARLEQRMARRAASGDTSSNASGARSGASRAQSSRQSGIDQEDASRSARQSERSGKTRGTRQSSQGSSSRSARQLQNLDTARGTRRGRQSSSSRKSRQAPQIGFLQLDGRDSSFFGGIPRWVIAVAAAAVVLLLIVVLAVIPRCSASHDEGQGDSAASSQSASASGQAAQGDTQTGAASESSGSASSSTASAGSSEQSQASSVDSDDEMQKALVDLIGEEETAKLLAAASTSTDALWVAAHPEELGFDGLEVQVKILKLAADEPAALPFVRSFPMQYPSTTVLTDESLALSSGSPSSDVPETKVPHLYQWDRRWGNTVYSSTAFGLTGCGPTSLAMAYQGATGKTDKNPHDMAVLAEERGYMSEFEGTANSFFTDLAGELGMTCTELYPTAENLTDALSNGQVVIANLAPGLFTENGHFFVLAGLAENGEVILNDPYSYERSSQLWPAETIAAESTVFYAYSA